MKKIILLCVSSILSVLLSEKSFSQTTLSVFDTVTYFDGYANVVSVPAPPAGVFRFRNDLYSRKLSNTELNAIGTTLDMKITVGALCDNYDRIGQVNMALVPKGQSTYNPDSVQHIELGRYITPFMNKNIAPTNVPYVHNIDNVAMLLKESSITAVYDIWIELQLFGVPYAANTEVSGCSGRNDVFHGSLDFITNTPAAGTQNNNYLIPVTFSANFNNYQAGATDTIGKTTKSFKINVPVNFTDATLFLITSNHGANSGGEEYNRRNHYVYFDNELKLTYKPGRTSCEPFRQYNTQSNGIYGATAKSDAQWQSFSNWCPGDIITTRIIPVGALTAGNHTFMITVPTAVFAGGQGNFPLSLYLQGKTSGTLGISAAANVTDLFDIYPNPANNQLAINNKKLLKVIQTSIINMMGITIYQSDNNFTSKTIETQKMNPGIYILKIHTDSGDFMKKIQVSR